MIAKLKHLFQLVWEKMHGKRSKKAVRNCIIAVVAVAVAAGSFWGYRHFFKKSGTASALTATVTRGSIAKTIEGSGTIAAIDQYEITSLVKGEILADYFSEGQEIQKGDLLYELDSSDAQSSIKRANTDVEKAQLSYEQSAKTLENLTITAPTSGMIQTLYIKNGDSVQNGAKIADIINSDQMTLTIDFNAADASALYAGAWAEVQLENSFSTLSGTVQSVASGSLPNADGVSVRSVEILVNNPGGIAAGDRATATVNGCACNAPGTFSYSEEQTITAKAAGEVTGLAYQQGDKIAKGAVIARLDSESTVNNIRQNQISLEQSRLSLESSQEQLEDYRITAPISGKVIQKNSKAGDKLDNTNSNTVMAIIADLSTLIFSISVDELDISNIAVGQTVQITADALEGQTFTGTVDTVSIVGTSSNGVTSYPVKVVVNQDNAEGLIPGMNVSAEIVIESREDVLRVPVSAVKRGNMVTVKTTDQNKNQTTDNTRQRPDRAAAPTGEGMPGGDMPGGQPPEGMPDGEMSGGQPPEGMPDSNRTVHEGSDERTAARPQASAAAKAGTDGAKGADIPAGYHAVQVETGLSDGNFIEIVSGLSEGDVVLLPDVSTSSNNQANMQGGMMGMGGGMPGGGMPGGGMPGGGGAPGGGGGNRSGGGGGAPGGR